MKQLFYALVLLAMVTSAYLKAMQLQDDAARALAQTMTDQKNEKPRDMSQSFEAIAQQVQAQQEPALSEESSVARDAVATTQASGTTWGMPVESDERIEKIREAETQVAELKLEPEDEALFTGKQPAHLYSALRRHLLIRLHPGYVRYENELYGRDEQLFQDQPLEGHRAITELYTSFTPDQMRAYGDLLQDLKNNLQARAESLRQESDHPSPPGEPNHE